MTTFSKPSVAVVGATEDDIYNHENLEEMMSNFDDHFPPSRFAAEQIRRFTKLVLTEFFSLDQNKVILAANSLKSTRQRVARRRNQQQQLKKQDNAACKLCHRPSATHPPILKGASCGHLFCCIECLRTYTDMMTSVYGGSTKCLICDEIGPMMLC